MSPAVDGDDWAMAWSCGRTAVSRLTGMVSDGASEGACAPAKDANPHAARRIPEPHARLPDVFGVPCRAEVEGVLIKGAMR